jgi:hypothetical protein
LLFSPKKQFDLSFFPNFIIGLTETNDTIAFLDKNFDKRIVIGSKIRLLPYKWTEVEKEIIKPAFLVHKKLKDNDLYCAVKEVYFGKIQLIKRDNPPYPQRQRTLKPIQKTTNNSTRFFDVFVFL